MYTPKYLTAIFFTQDKRAWKYHNIKNTVRKRQLFEEFAKSKGAVAVNYYDNKTGQFIRPQIKLT